jgi:integrase
MSWPTQPPRALSRLRRAVRLERGTARFVDELKTDASYRTIALSAPAKAELRRQRSAVAEMRLASRTWVVDDPGPVFPTVNGGPWNPVNARAELAHICTDNGLPVVRPKALRHSCVTVHSERGVPLELIADLLGHTWTRMLDMTYRHRPRRAVDAAVDVMDRLFEG